MQHPPQDEYDDENLANSNRALTRMLMGGSSAVSARRCSKCKSNRCFCSAKSPRDHSQSPTTSAQKTESEFMQTNASIFDRNPFKEFTTNRLSDILLLKDTQQLADMREEALQYGEKLEAGFIRRLERKK